jgi:hypothetical protein
MGDRILELNEVLGTLSRPNRQVARLIDAADDPGGRIAGIGADQHVSLSGGWRLTHAGQYISRVNRK